jgi:hypothetical protein
MASYDPHIAASLAISKVERSHASTVRKFAATAHTLQRVPEREDWCLTEESMIAEVTNPRYDPNYWKYTNDKPQVLDFHKLVYKGVTISSNLEVLKQFNLFELRAILTLFYIQVPTPTPRSALKMAIHFVEELLKPAANADEINNHADLIRELNELKAANERLHAQLTAIKSAFD